LKKFGLSANERIKSRKDFDRLYSFGKVIYSSKKRIKTIYLLEVAENKPSIQIAAVVPKKSGSAYWRNRVKRLIKEAYRLNKDTIVRRCAEKNISAQIVFMSFNLSEKTNKKIRLNDLLPEVLDNLYKIMNSI
jgi:ribonuclease P protein component